MKFAKYNLHNVHMQASKTRSEHEIETNPQSFGTRSVSYYNQYSRIAFSHEFHLNDMIPYFFRRTSPAEKHFDATGTKYVKVLSDALSNQIIIRIDAVGFYYRLKLRSTPTGVAAKN